MFALGDRSHANLTFRTEYLMYAERIRQGRNCFMILNSREDTIAKGANNIEPILINSYSLVLSPETIVKSIAENLTASSENGTEDKGSFQSFLSRLSNSETECLKPKIYNKERIRLKYFSNLKNVLSLQGFLICLILALTVLSQVSNGENVQNCPGKCSCETFATPTVSSVQNIWPTLLASSIYPDTLSIPFRGPTSFEALISSILTNNNTIDDPTVGSENNRHVKTSKGFFQTTGGFSTSQIHPGEVSIDCSNRRFHNFSTLSSIFDQQLISSVVKLDLSSNAIKNVRREDFEDFSSLRYLNLATNQLTTLAEEDVLPLPNLILLSLHGNRIYDIHKDALLNVSKLQVLDLTHNYLSEVPEAVKRCTELKQIFLGDNRITYIKEETFSGLVKLQWVDLARNPLLDVHNSAFVGLPSLVKLILESVRDLDVVPSFNGTSNVEAVRIDRASIAAVPANICSFLPHLKSLNLHLNVIHELPDVSNCKELRLLDLSNNKISDLRQKLFIEVSSLHDLLLQYNFIEFISNDAFVGLTNLQVLNLEYNRITVIEPDAFLPLISLEDINLGNNQFPEIPSVGLERVVLLKAHNNRHLRIFPGPESFPSVHSLILSYAYHCCPFLSAADGEGVESSTEIHEDVVFSIDQLHKFDPTIWNNTNVWPHIEGIPTSEFLNVWAKQEEQSGGELVLNGTFPFSSKKIALLRVKDGNISKFIPFNGTGYGRKSSPHNIQCIPQPGPFMPCRDLFDWWTLRCGVWLVFLLALMGNGVVVVVLVSAYSKMDVPRFLVSNLALADFFMGIYLGFLAVVDASTLGDFRMYAIPWQMSVGCQLAGFLGVLSSELSVYTLTVITMERNYAITHAMHLNKRLSLKHAAYIMAVGWVFAVTMAVLPLAGISDYRKFAVCLPFETDGAGLEYIVFLMLINGVAFLILMGCYLKIYCAIRGSQAWNSNDSRIAKRMALLVFTDFICWAPIAFFSLSAAFGLQLISLEGAKVFTVFVLPFNSCCNPFLYALLTKQFKKDCVMLCKAIEESRVTRGIGRCRHSSNFSNRQTPVNTNSALDQNSKEDHHGCNCKLKVHQIHRKNVAVRAMRFLCCQSDAKLASASGKSSNLLIRSPLKMARATTLDCSKMNSSWSWRGQSASNLRLLELRKQTTLDLARKSSQESSLSSSRNDSSGTTGSTVTWGISRSSVSSDTSSGGAKGPRTGSVKDHSKDDGDCVAKAEMGIAGKPTFAGYAKPRLQRQRAVDKDPGSVYFAGNELRCPLHARGDNLSCVYEQASLEEEDSNEVFLVSQPPCITHKHTHKRSLSDGLLCGTLLSLSAPTPQLISSIAPTLQISKSLAKEKNAKTYSDSSEVKTESYDDGLSTDDAAKPDGLLETHFPIDAIGEVDPLLHRKSFSN